MTDVTLASFLELFAPNLWLTVCILVANVACYGAPQSFRLSNNGQLGFPQDKCHCLKHRDRNEACKISRAGH